MYDELSERKFHPFLRTIISHPQLAIHVKRLDVRSLRRPDNGDSSTSQSPEDATSLIQIIDANHILKCPDWISFLTTGRWNEPYTIRLVRGAYLALAFAHLCNLELLRFEVTKADFDSTWKTFDLSLRR